MKDGSRENRKIINALRGALSEDKKIIKLFNYFDKLDRIVARQCSEIESLKEKVKSLDAKLHTFQD